MKKYKFDYKTIIFIQIIFLLIVFLIINLTYPNEVTLLLKDDIKIDIADKWIKEVIDDRNIHNIDGKEYIIGINDKFKLREFTFIIYDMRYFFLIILINPILIILRKIRKKQ